MDCLAKETTNANSRDWDFMALNTKAPALESGRYIASESGSLDDAKD
jgi:hypothetical protein